MHNQIVVVCFTFSEQLRKEHVQITAPAFSHLQQSSPLGNVVEVESRWCGFLWDTELQLPHACNKVCISTFVNWLPVRICLMGLLCGLAVMWLPSL